MKAASCAVVFMIIYMKYGSIEFIVELVWQESVLVSFIS